MLTVNPQYALAQLERALVTAESHPDAETERRARARVEAWIRVIEGMREGALHIGSRTPTAAPSWATLEVVHGGFATGELLAGGPLLAHEEMLAKRLGIEPTDRSAFALHFLSDIGRAELGAMLASGCFRIDVPEEGALLSVVALLAHGAPERAAAVIEAIAPYFDRLRFYPQPETRPIAPVSTVHVATVGEVRAELAHLDTPLEIRRMNEALAIWAPLTDRAVDLFLETVKDGTPCRVFPLDWHARASVLLADHTRARAAHRMCTKPHRPKENLAILMRALTRITKEQGALSKRELGLVRVAIEGHVKKHGAPGSERRRAHRTTQARIASLPTRGESAQVLTARLESLPADQGLGSLDEVGAPMSTGPLWPSVLAKLERCLDASIEELIARGVLTSGEALADVLPQISAHVRALGFTDPAVARLHAAIDAAFRRRRSLLLLNYQSQVKLEELPWVAALEPLRTRDVASKEGAKQLFSHVTALAIESFPQVIVPNPLLGELRELAKRAELELPLVDELAADIFMGGFTSKFVHSAAIVARRLEGTLYARYYALPIAEVRATLATLSSTEESVWNRLLAKAAKLLGKPRPVDAFGALCERMANLEPNLGRSVVRNGRVIEQQQILTTQNLVPLIDAAGLAADRFPELAWRSFEWLIKRVQAKASRHDQRRAARNAAFTWRQMIVYLSLCPPDVTDAFLVRAREHLTAQPEAFQARFAPILAGLESAHAGRTPATRLLGWTAGEHPLGTGSPNLTH